jgi:hypothetical protein
MEDFYWNRYREGPFATLIRITTTCLHPEAIIVGQMRGRLLNPAN